MRIRDSVTGAALVLAFGATGSAAQKPPAVRQIGRVERTSADSLASASVAKTVPGGVLVNDMTGRRLVLFDSTLTHMKIVADTTAATAGTYGSRQANLIRYRGDTTLLIDVVSLSMYVIGPAGSVGRVMAVPRPDDAQALWGGDWGQPGFDARGRLVYFGSLNSLPGAMMLVGGRPLPTDPRFLRMIEASRHVDSAAIVRAELTTRTLDTAAWISIPKSRRELKVDAQGLLVSIETTPDPLPVVDGWAVMPDGSIAIVRGRDYHVDWIDANGKLSSSPKMPFDWQRVGDERKQALIDSTVTSWQGDFDRIIQDRKGASGGGGGSAGGGGRGGSGGGGGAGRGPLPDLAPMIAVRRALTELPDYWPPMRMGAVSADADGNLWIRTTSTIKDQPVYDIVNRRGELFDRVQLPPFRTIAGFGPGVIYMAVTDPGRVVHVERARIR